MKPYIFLLSGMLSAASVTYAANDKTTLVINELMQSNIDGIMDDLKDFPDSWVELYNPTDAAINLKDYKIGIKKKAEKAWQLPDQVVGPKQFALIYCDKAGENEGVSALHTDFRLESGKDGKVYLFKGDEGVDSLVKMAAQPAPNIAYGRKTDGEDEWGYQLTPTPNASNRGVVCDGDHILGTPVFSKAGRVVVGSQNFKLALSVPEGSPNGTVIRYTTDGKEPTSESTKYTAEIPVTSSMVVRAKLFCKGWLSPYSTVQSYIVHDKSMTMPVISIVMDDRYLNDAEIGIFANNNSHEKSQQHDWRRPMNIELFDAEESDAKLNQLGETRITGAWSREASRKSMAIYAHKRFGQKRLNYEFFPDQCPGLTDYKSVVLRNAGNDRDGLYMRDAIAQRTMAENTDIDWQAWRPAVIYINGKYHCILNIRERANEDNVLTHYNTEDIDLLENGELKEGTRDKYDAFTAFYTEHGHTLAEYAEWMDWQEYINIVAMNLYFNNLDYPGNNNVIWRPSEEGGKWRFIAKDIDYSMGLYGGGSGGSGGYDHNLLAQWYNPDDQNLHQGANFSISWDDTRLFRRMMEDDDFKREFIDRMSIYMGDFLNEKGIHAVWDPMYNLLMTQWQHHRDVVYGYNSWWPNYEGEMNNVRTWISKRTGEMYKHIGSQFGLGSPLTLTINKQNSGEVAMTFNDVELKGNVFDGKFYAGRTIKLSGQSKGDKELSGWKVTGAITKEYQGSELTLTMPNGAIAINPVFSDPSGIQTIDNLQFANDDSVYDLMGNKVTTPRAGRIYIWKGKKITWR